MEEYITLVTATSFSEAILEENAFNKVFNNSATVANFHWRANIISLLGTNNRKIKSLGLTGQVEEHY